MSRPDPCSVDFGCEAPKFWFGFCYGFFVWIFSSCFFSKEKRPEKIKSTKNPPQSSPGTLFRKIPLGFLQKPSLENVGLLEKPWSNIFSGLFSGHVRPRQGTEICNFRAPSPRFFEFSPVDVLLCNSVRIWPQNVEKIARFPGEAKAHTPVTSVAVMVFSVLNILFCPSS